MHWEVVVHGGGANLYRIWKKRSKFIVDKVDINFIPPDSYTKIGEADTFEDALEIIRRHSGHQIESVRRVDWISGGILRQRKSLQSFQLWRDGRGKESIALVSRKKLNVEFVLKNIGQSGIFISACCIVIYALFSYGYSLSAFKVIAAVSLSSLAASAVFGVVRTYAENMRWSGTKISVSRFMGKLSLSLLFGGIVAALLLGILGIGFWWKAWMLCWFFAIVCFFLALAIAPWEGTLGESDFWSPDVSLDEPKDLSAGRR
ncbi:MAG TPA: hypothetical protein VNH64_05390 [Parvularculaceae bacterium]|nr:hypothetical protein [Parvularculaceae bacterium]